jgi:hypothetical protein
MFGWFSGKAVEAKETDYVALRMIGNEILVKPVEWDAGLPYAAPYLHSTSGRLLAGGEFNGPGYVLGWYPASPRMVRLYAEPARPKPPEPEPSMTFSWAGAQALDEGDVRWIVQDELKKRATKNKVKVEVKATKATAGDVAKAMGAAVHRSKNR